MKNQKTYQYEENIESQRYRGSLQSEGELKGNVELTLIPFGKTIGEDKHYE
jgi:hypothetical protein